MSLTVKQLEMRHPDWTAMSEFWGLVELLYRGGKAMVDNASRFLDRRPAEAEKVYQARCNGATYQNILGAGLGWYEAKLFTEEPQFYIRRGAEAVQDEWLESWLANCDRGGRKLTELMAQWWLLAVRDGMAYVLVDLPGSSLAQTFRAQKALGELDPYVVTFEAAQVTNWQMDAQGSYDWLVVSTDFWRGGLREPRQRMRRWTYFDRTDFQVYEAVMDGSAGDGPRTAAMVGAGRHALAEQRRVPVHRIAPPFHLWLTNRVFPQVRDHFNADNGLKWALLMANLAVPVVTGEFSENPTISETGYIKLEQGGTFGWSEPNGSSFAHSAARVASLREEIYRQMYLQAQGRDSSANASANSGYSKEMDMAPSRDVLNAFGDMMRAAAHAVLRDILLVRGRGDIEVSVQGLVFDDGDGLRDIEQAAAALDLGIPGATFERLVLKRMARTIAGKVDPDTLAAMDAEIDGTPTREERGELERRRRAEEFGARLQTQMEADDAE